MSGLLGIGVVGANPDRGWASRSHLPALAALQDIRLAAVATTRLQSAEAAAQKFGAGRAYGDWRELVADPSVDIVSVCVQVPKHREIVLGAIAAGKGVFCEWPLGLSSMEAIEMRDAAHRQGVENVVGLQGRLSPTINAIREHVASGEVGVVRSVTLVSSLPGAGAGQSVEERQFRAYRESGVGALMVAAGHTLDALCHIAGPFAEVSAEVTTQNTDFGVTHSGEPIVATAPDQVLVTGRLHSGAVASVHVKTDIRNPTGIRLEINGCQGDIVARTPPDAGPLVGIQRTPLIVEIARGPGQPYIRVEDFARHELVGGLSGAPYYTAQVYAGLVRRRRGEEVSLPDFDAAVAHHALIETVQRASDAGQRQVL